MAHMIDTQKGRAAIAYVGETPWHGLGRKLTAGLTPEQWQNEAGLDYTVQRTPVQFTNGELRTFPNLDVLYRSDTNHPLSVVSKYYNVHQPSEIFNLYSEIAKAGGFSLETAGALSDGKRIWALARVNDGAPIVEKDVVRPYLLLATSYDGTMATTARFTAIRVVCHNTISMVVGSYDPASGSRSGGEAVVERNGISSCVKINHDQKIDVEAIRLQLGVVVNSWERFLLQARQLANSTMKTPDAEGFVEMLLAPKQEKKDKPVDVRKGTNFQRLMDLFNGQAIGSSIAPETRWQALNAVTQFVDHERGGDKTRLDSAWFGSGNALKDRALVLLTQ